MFFVSTDRIEIYESRVVDVFFIFINFIGPRATADKNTKKNKFLVVGLGQKWIDTRFDLVTQIPAGLQTAPGIPASIDPFPRVDPENPPFGHRGRVLLYPSLTHFTRLTLLYIIFIIFFPLVKLSSYPPIASFFTLFYFFQALS